MHRRGYRQFVVPGALRETLAAAVVRAAAHDWRRDEAAQMGEELADNDEPLAQWPLSVRRVVDPQCGGGTLLLEAALMSWEQRSGQLFCTRTFACEHWRTMPARSETEAAELARQIDFSLAPTVLGSDHDTSCVRASRGNAMLLGASERRAHKMFRQLDASALLRTVSESASDAVDTMLLCNAPFGWQVAEPNARARQQFLEQCATLRGTRAYVLLPHAVAAKFSERDARSLLQFSLAGKRVELLRLLS